MLMNLLPKFKLENKLQKVFRDCKVERPYQNVVL